MANGDSSVPDQLEVSMAGQEPTAKQSVQIAVENEDDPWVSYKPEAQKSIQEIQDLDKDVAMSADSTIPNVVVNRLTLVCTLALDSLDLDMDLEQVTWRISINSPLCGSRALFPNEPGNFVQHEVHPAPIEGSHQTDKTNYLVGSYGPRQRSTSSGSVEEAPKGKLAYSSYSRKSCFTDVDKTDHLF